MFLNTFPVFLSSFIYVGLTLGQMLSVSTESYKPFNIDVDEVQIITKACTLCATILSKLTLSLDFHLCGLVVMQAALICKVFWRFVAGWGRYLIL